MTSFGNKKSTFKIMLPFKPFLEKKRNRIWDQMNNIYKNFPFIHTLSSTTKQLDIHMRFYNPLH